MTARADPSHLKLAAFDVGSNTILMLALEYARQGAPRTLADLARITRLGRGVDRSGRLDPESAARTLATIEEFASRARALGVDRIVGVATAALRDAADGTEFIARVRERTGVALEVISGIDEARLSYLAVARGLPIDPAARLLIVDIGGGSTEFIRAEPGRELAAMSLQIGSVRLTERCVRSDPPSDADVASLRETIDAALGSIEWTFRPDRMVGIAGTVTTVCAVALGLETYDSRIVHGHVLPLGEVRGALELFRSRPLAERKKLPGLIEGRADVIFAGAMILERAMCRFGVEEVIVSDQGVRYGLAWREIERSRATMP
ncbi:MAG TPA: Ppx/GppA phosphatase family protein [Candidatus Binataceae bacterium]|nr:Ppx/GppA phosphatase family protein [Candidatus Binataceae bacterium]